MQVPKHVSEIGEQKCDKKVCQKRHLKSCRFGLRCRWQNKCEYKHYDTTDEGGFKAEIKRLESTIKVLVEENKSTKTKMDNLESELRTSLKKVLLESKEKDTTIKVLKEKLENEEKLKKESKM